MCVEHSLSHFVLVVVVVVAAVVVVAVVAVVVVVVVWLLRVGVETQVQSCGLVSILGCDGEAFHV